MSLYVINRTFLNAVGQPLADLTCALLVGTLNGTSPSPATTTTQPGRPLATVYGDPNSAHLLTNPTTYGTNTITTDGYGNLCSVINGVKTLGIYVNTSGYGAHTYFVLQAYGPGILGQQLIPITFPSGGG